MRESLMVTSLYVIAFLSFNNKVLLIRRVNATFGDGLYSLVGGKVEPGETALQAIKREVHEEVDLEIPESNFELVHTMHRKGTDAEFVALCFKADVTDISHVRNNEPDKHDDVQFFNLHSLPTNIIPAHKQVIESVLKTYTLFRAWLEIAHNKGLFFENNGTLASRLIDLLEYQYQI